MRKYGLLLVAAVLVAFVWEGARSQPPSPALPPVKLPSPAPEEGADEAAELDGKVVMVTTPTDGVRTIEKVRIVRIARRAFLTGRAVQLGSADGPEMTYWVPVDVIQGMATFKNKEDALRAVKRSKGLSE